MAAIVRTSTALAADEVGGCPSVVLPTAMGVRWRKTRGRCRRCAGVGSMSRAVASACALSLLLVALPPFPGEASRLRGTVFLLPPTASSELSLGDGTPPRRSVLGSVASAAASALLNPGASVADGSGTALDGAVVEEAMTLFQEGRYEASEALWRRLETQAPENPFLQTSIVSCILSQAGQCNEFGGSLGTMATLHRQDFAPSTNAGEDEAAARQAENLLRKDPECIDARALLAAIRWERGDEGGAETAWTEICEGVKPAAATNLLGQVVSDAGLSLGISKYIPRNGGYTFCKMYSSMDAVSLRWPPRAQAVYRRFLSRNGDSPGRAVG